MKESRFGELFNFDHVLTVVALLLAIITILLARETRENALRITREYWRATTLWVVFLTLSIGLAILVWRKSPIFAIVYLVLTATGGFVIARQHKNSQLAAQLGQLQEKYKEAEAAKKDQERLKNEALDQLTALRAALQASTQQAEALMVTESKAVVKLKETESARAEQQQAKDDAIAQLTAVSKALQSANLKLEELKAEKSKSDQERDATLAAQADAHQREDQAKEERDAALAERDKAVAARKTYEIVPRPRWEELREIRYGHLEYKPFLLYDLNQLAVGLGVDLLEQLFTYPVSGGAVHLEPDGDPRDWTTIFDDLIAGVFDVVATPLFATYERSQRVGFSAPLFFSNVGLYMKETVANDGRWKNITAGEMRKRLRNANVFKLLAIKGEISKSLADGIFDAWDDGRDPASPQQSSSGCIEPRPSTTRLPNLLQTIATSEDPPYALFCESFTAELQPVVASGKVVNVLRDHEILYPVCFAVRHGDYQLRNLLNIRLMDFARSIDGGVLKLLEDNLPKYGYKGTTPAFMRKHFVERWPPPPSSPPANGSVHAEAQV